MAKEAGKNPADTPENDTVGGGIPWWQEEARQLANTAEMVSIWTGLLGSAATLAGAATLSEGVGVPLEIAGQALLFTSMGFAGLNAVLSGIGYGVTSSEFKHALGSLALHLITFGQSKWIEAFGGSKVVTAFTRAGHEVISAITGLLRKLTE